MNMLGSFQVPEEGIEAQAQTFPNVAQPPAEPELYSLPTSPDAQVWDPEPDANLPHGLAGHSVSGRRGHYSCAFYDASGVMVAGVSQEALVRVPSA